MFRRDFTRRYDHKIETSLEGIEHLSKDKKEEKERKMKENNEKKIKNCDEVSKLIKAFPKDIAALDKRSVLAKVNSQGSGR